MNATDVAEGGDLVAELKEENRELKNRNRLLEFKVQLLSDLLTCERLDSLAREQKVLELVDTTTS